MQSPTQRVRHILVNFHQNISFIFLLITNIYSISHFKTLLFYMSSVLNKNNNKNAIITLLLCIVKGEKLWISHLKKTKYQ